MFLHRGRSSIDDGGCISQPLPSHHNRAAAGRLSESSAAGARGTNHQALSRCPKLSLFDGFPKVAVCGILHPLVPWGRATDLVRFGLSSATALAGLLDADCATLRVGLASGYEA